MMIKRMAAFSAAAGLALALVACGSNTTTAAGSTASSGSPAGSSAAMTSGSSAPMSSDSAMSSGAMTSGAMTSGAMTSGAMTSGAMTSGAMTSGAMTSGAMGASGLVGPGCAAYAKAVPSGAGSVDGMAADSVATAASHNPLLMTLVAAVSGKVNPKVNLVPTLNGGEFTVFAPVDAAFKKVDAATMGKLSTDSALLTKILTYHIVEGQLDPKAVIGSHKTVEGGTVKVTGSGDTLKVDGASVICGGVKTKNATVYLIDSVLSPTS